MRVMTCNIRFSSAADTGTRHWAARKDLCINTIMKRNPDVICLQECHNDQLSDFIEAIGDRYDWIAGLTFAAHYYPENAVFYRKAKYRKLGAGAYHLSEKPHVNGFKSWDSNWFRFVNWVLLGGPFTQFRIINTHFDHVSQLAREKSAEMINEDAAAWDSGLAQILTGDLNCDPSNRSIQILESAGWTDSLPEKERFTLTAHSFEGRRENHDFGICGQGRMDYVYTRGKVRTRASEIIYDSDGKVFPSDHYFVAADLDFMI